MGFNTKALVFFSTLLIILGFSFLWFGLKLAPKEFLHVPTPIAETSPIATTSAVVGVESERVLVTEVVDGDTIKVESQRTVRLLGIDTPETKDPRKSVQCFGKEAALETKNLLSGKVVLLQKDLSETDKYRRLLRYVFLPIEDGEFLFVNDYLIREGFARVLTFPPDVKYTQQFLEAQRQAKELKKGLWGKC